MTLGDKIKDFRLHYQLTQGQLAKILNVSDVTINRYEKNKRTPDLNTLKLIAQTFDTSIDYLLGQKETPEPYIEKKTSSIFERRIPILSHIEEGVPLCSNKEILGYEEISLNLSENGEHFAILAKDKSMTPKIYPKDLVIVRQDEKWSNNDTVVIRLDKEILIRRIKKEPKGILLFSSNPQFEPSFYTLEEKTPYPFQVLGIAVERRGKI